MKNEKASRRGFRAVMRSRVGALVVAGLTIAATAVAVPISVSSATSLTTLNVAEIGGSYEATTLIGENAGIFAHYGLKLNLSFVSSPTISYADLLSGSAQIGFASTGSLIPADMAGEGIKYITNIEPSPIHLLPYPNNKDSLMVATGSPITSAAQLAGKTVALANLSAGSEIFLAIAVTKAGGNISKVNLVSVPYANMAAEIANGTITAAVETAPYYTQAGQQQLENLDPLTPGSPGSAYAATASYIASHKALISAFVKAQQQSILYTAANFSKLTPTILAESAGVPVSEASSFTVPTKINFSTDLNPPGILSYQELMQTYGFLAAGPLMPISALSYTAPGTPMTKLLFNAAGKFIVKKTITCVKGKLTKKVTGVNPKCPSGYHLKK
jgi:NitT/TauT family transport system substrate-binding protein